MNALILSISMGAGHIKAAEAVREAVEEKFPGSKTLIIDTFKYINPFVDKLIVGSYLNTLKSTPRIYGKLYTLTESGDNIYDFSKAINKILSFKIKNLIKEFKPSIIVCTHPFPLQMVSNLKNKNKIFTPLVAILTDFVTHPFWIHDNVDAYVVAHEYMKQDMINKGIPEHIVYPYGIPVSKDFLHKKDKNKVLKEMGLEQKPTFLIMGGSLGFGEIRDTFLSLVNCKKDLQIIAVTGKNSKLKERLEKYSEYSDKNIKILSYTNRIADLMDISDFIITKPGGLTISEALIKELPILIISPIPGQEERNAHFLTNSGVAVRILESDDMDVTLMQIAGNPLRVTHMKEMARFLAKPGSRDDVVDLMDKLVNGINKKETILKA